jgi:hypothetical protein
MSEIKVKAPKVDREGTFDYSFGDNLDEAVAKFGAETVFNCFENIGIIRVQDLVRRLMSEEKSDSDITEYLANYVFGAKRERTATAKLDTVETDAEKRLTRFYVIKALGLQAASPDEQNTAYKKAGKEAVKDGKESAKAERLANTKNWQSALKKAKLAADMAAYE